MAVLLTGGTGKTSIRLARFFQDAQIPFLLASRRGGNAAASASGYPAIKFDWLDSTTFAGPFEYKFPDVPDGEKTTISAVYLVAPSVAADPSISMNAFVDYAIKEHGVKRFVILGGSTADIGGPHIGKVWQHLVEIGLGCCVLMPTWFMENFTEEEQGIPIKAESKIYTACGDGKIPFISATDIAAVAFRALTDPKPHNTGYRILGPEPLTHDQVAAKISNSLGRKIVNVKLTGDQRIQKYIEHGVSEDRARFLTYLELLSADNAENKTNDVVEKVTGRPGRTFDAFAEENKAAWQ